MVSLGRLSLKTKFALTVALFSALVTASLATLYLQRSAQEARESFIVDQKLFAQVFSDGAARYVESNRLDELGVLARTTVLGNYLYAQVARGGQVLVEEKAPRAEGTSLPLIAQPPKSQAVVEQLPSGQRYLDIVRSFSISAGSGSPSAAEAVEQGYVRIGVALAPLDAQLGSQMLTILGLGAGLVLFIFLLAWVAARLLFGSGTTTVIQAKGEVALGSVTVPAPVATDGVVGQPVSGDLSIDDATKRVTVRGGSVELSPKEYEVLKLLASGRGRVFSSDDILAHVWTGRDFASAQDVKQYIYFLRQKLEEDPEHPKLILTVRGFGYKLAE
jgi:hypothetical protein